MTKTPYTLTSDTMPSLNVLVYGPSGVGKTYFAGTTQDVPAMRETLVLNADKGLLTLVERGDIDVIDVDSAKDVDAVVWDIADGSLSKYKTVVVDSVTALQDVVLQEIRRKAGRKEGETQLQDYGQLSQQLGASFRRLRDLPVNVIFTALPKRRFGEGDNGALRSVDPDVIESLSNKILGLVDFGWYMFQRETTDEETGEITQTRHALTQSSGVTRAKTRGAAISERIPTILDNPSMPILYDAISEGVGRAGDE